MKLLTSIQLNKEISNVFPFWFNWAKKQIDNKNETTTVNVPIVPEIVLLTFFPKKILKRNPTNGDKSNTKAKFFSIPDYPFKFFKLSISMEPKFRKTETRIANPTATSAAATAIEKNTNTCPSES